MCNLLILTSFAYQNLILGIERDWRDDRRTTIFKNMTSKYKEYHTKHQTLVDFLNQDGEFQSLRDGLK